MEDSILYKKNPELVRKYRSYMLKIMDTNYYSYSIEQDLYSSDIDTRIRATLAYYNSVLLGGLKRFPNGFWSNVYHHERELICYLYLRECLVKDAEGLFITHDKYAKYKLSGMLSANYSHNPRRFECALSKIDPDGTLR